MSKSKATVSNPIAKFSYRKLGYTPPKIFKKRARIIKLMAGLSKALNEHLKVMGDPDFIYSFANEDELFAALEKAVNYRADLEYALAYATDALFYYDQNEWAADGYDCESIMVRNDDEWDKRSKSVGLCVKIAKPEAAK